MYKCLFLMRRILVDMRLHGFESPQHKQDCFETLMKINRLAAAECWDDVYEGLEDLEFSYSLIIHLGRDEESAQKKAA